MPRTIQVTLHARERWEERIGSGSLLRSVRRARRAGPRLRRRIHCTEDALVAVDYRKKAVFICQDDAEGNRVVVTVLNLTPRNPRSE